MMLQFPAPVPPAAPAPSPPSLFECIVLSFMLVFLVGIALPRPWFEWMFRIAFPFVPAKLSDWDKPGDGQDRDKKGNK